MTGPQDRELPRLLAGLLQEALKQPNQGWLQLY
jgi:hypothetical protein